MCSKKSVQKGELQKVCSELLLVIGRPSGKNTLISSQFSVNLFLIDLHQTSKEIQSMAAKKGFGKLSNCGAFGALPHYPLL